MPQIEIASVDALRKKSKRSWTDSGQEHHIIKHNGTEVCVGVLRKKPHFVDRTIDEEIMDKKPPKLLFLKIEGVLINDSIPFYQQKI